MTQQCDWATCPKNLRLSETPLPDAPPDRSARHHASWRVHSDNVARFFPRQGQAAQSREYATGDKAAREDPGAATEQKRTTEDPALAFQASMLATRAERQHDIDGSILAFTFTVVDQLPSLSSGTNPSRTSLPLLDVLRLHVAGCYGSHSPPPGSRLLSSDTSTLLRLDLVAQLEGDPQGTCSRGVSWPYILDFAGLRATSMSRRHWITSWCAEN